MPCIARHFPVWLFLNVTLSELRCNSFSMSFIHLVFLLCSFCSRFLLQNCFVSFASTVVGMYSCILHLLAGRIFFHCFRMTCFICIVWSCLSIFLVFLLLPLPFDLSSWVVLFFYLLCFSSFFIPTYFHVFLFLSIFACYYRFPICVSSLISDPGFDALCLIGEQRL